jgi:hypothetical protein
MTETLRPLTGEDVHAIWLAVKDGRGNHGDFLKAFAEAIVRADDENLAILMPAAMRLIVKFDLISYRDPLEGS